MILIIMHHYCRHGGFFDNLSLNNISLNLIFTQIFSIGKFANHIFILITGYFMVKSKVNYKKIILLIIEMFFYSIFIGVLFYGFRIIQFDKKTFIKSFFPILYGNWFLIYYILLYLMIPYLNLFVQNITKRQFQNIILILFILYILIPTFSNNSWGFTRHDYFILDYFMGAYISTYPFKILKNKGNKKIFMVIFSILTLYIFMISFLILLGIVLKSNKILSKSIYFINNDFSILNFATALIIFTLFINIDIKNNKFINNTSKSLLGIYLIHDNPIFRQWLWNIFWPNKNFINSNMYLLHMITKVILIFIMCLIIDKIRIFLFKNFEKKFVNEYFENILYKTKKILNNKFIIKNG